MPFRPVVTLGVLCVSLFGAWPAVAASLTLQVRDDAGQPVEDAVVYAVASDATPVPRGSPIASAMVAQADKKFVPTVSVVQTGAAISFPNNDTVRHHVYSFSPAKTFELKLYIGVPNAPLIFDRAGLVVLGCNIHDQMLAYIAVVPTPFFAKTGARGEAVLNGLGPGVYEVHLWHPRGPALGSAKPMSVTLRDEPRQRLDMRIELKPALATPEASKAKVST